MTIEHVEATGQRNTDEFLHLLETKSGVGSTASVRLSQDIVAQISGTATSIDAVLERSVADPGTTSGSWAPAEDLHFSGDLSAGIAARPYYEPLSAFYRMRIISISGGTATISLIGKQAQ